MKQWEYKRLQGNDTSDGETPVDDGMIESLNALGNLGWEVVWVGCNPRSSHVAVLKREKIVLEMDEDLDEPNADVSQWTGRRFSCQQCKDTGYFNKDICRACDR